jgi:hypothetical protein
MWSFIKKWFYLKIILQKKLAVLYEMLFGNQDEEKLYNIYFLIAHLLNLFGMLFI